MRGWGNAEFEFDSVEEFEKFAKEDRMWDTSQLANLVPSISLSNENSAVLVAVDIEQLKDRVERF